MSKANLDELLIATRNKGKVRELEALLSGLPVRLRSLQEFPQLGEVAETGATFAENAALKAQTYARAAGVFTLADDSGLEVEALNGAPGIFSARYAGADATDAERITRLLHELDRTQDELRRARFVCVIAIADSSGELLHVSEGVCAGGIAHAPSGDNGFGYDPIFIPDGYAQSFAELSAQLKQQISHRARALKQARAFLQTYSPNRL
ncbi:MAG: XTP/dITP diphosphatase [Pyrinomonadaceae bacterium]